MHARRLPQVAHPTRSNIVPATTQSGTLYNFNTATGTSLRAVRTGLAQYTQAAIAGALSNPGGYQDMFGINTAAGNATFNQVLADICAVCNAALV